MEVDVIGRVANVDIPFARSLQPLFEAVANSVHSIQDRFGADAKKQGRIEIKIERDTRQQNLKAKGDLKQLGEVIGFGITDNGVGFNERNFTSFSTSDTQHKVVRGGKGMGRFSWLVVFDRAEVTSTFEQDGKSHTRTFEFRRTAKGIEHHHVTEEGGLPKTVVRLVGFRPGYKTTKTAEVIARRLLENCLPDLVLGDFPSVTFRDPDGDPTADAFDLEDLFKRTGRVAQHRSISVRDQPFRIFHIFRPSSADQKNEIHLCANGRSVETRSFRGVPHLDRPLISEDGERILYTAFVSGQVLDKAVTSNRLGFNLPAEPDDLLLPGQVDERTLMEAIATDARTQLAPFFDRLGEERLRAARSFVSTQAPHYRHLLTRRIDEIKVLPAAKDARELDLQLYRIGQDHELAVRQEFHEFEKAIEGDKSAGDPDIEKFVGEYLEKISEVGRGDLARYVAKRKAVIEVLQRCMQAKAGPTPPESRIHRVIFPMRKTSDDVSFDDHNLWVVDDTLAFHQYLASDLAWSQMKQLQVEGLDRPDILVFGSGNEPFSSVTLIEFKRADRSDFGEMDDDNPIAQVIRYAKKLREGTARDRNNAQFPIQNSTRIDAFVIASLNPALEKAILYAGFLRPAAGGEGYVGFHEQLNLLLEVLPIRKLVRRARERNFALFHKLGIPP